MRVVTAILAEVEVALDANAAVGESPTWDSVAGALLWVDIPAKRLHSYTPASGQALSRNVGAEVGAVVARERGGFVLALADGFALLDSWDADPRLFCPVAADDPAARLNDSKVDSAGRLWGGTMAVDASLEPTNSLYRLETNGELVKTISGVGLSNGIAWSPDDETMYYVDSATQRIDAFEFDPGTGAIAARRALVEIPPEHGTPDGLAVDAEGCLWLALWGGWAVRRYSPEGEPLGELPVPVERVTSCAFGGPDLSDLYVTTASQGVDEASRSRQPHAGALFRCELGVVGLPSHGFGG
jgi:sugar lactone lactonase YvrE